MLVQSVVSGAAFAVVIAVTHAHADSPLTSTPATPAAATMRESSLGEYRRHLLNLASIVDSCAKARGKKTCDPSLIGPDDKLPVGAGSAAESRPIRYDWLRVLLLKAQDKDEPAPKPKSAQQADPGQESALPAKRTTAQLLEDARARLAADLSQADGANSPSSSHSQERDIMKKVLAGREFRNLEDPTARDALLERISSWLNRFFAGVAKLKDRSAWIGRLIVWGFILAVSVGLVGSLLHLERRWRIRLVPEGDAPASGAASSRDWQLWLDDACNAASAGHWREAIHCVYWASISRLESRRLWPADRARTPREYLALVAADDARRPGLSRLTGSFERFWYGGRTAAEGDYRRAEELAAGLISRADAPAISGEPAK